MIHIFYIEDKDDLKKLKVGAPVYFDGKFFTVSKIANNSNKSMSCPCASYGCSFKKTRQDNDNRCPYIRSCVAVNRKDKTSVFFRPFEPTGDQIDFIKQECEKHGKDFVYEESN